MRQFLLISREALLAPLAVPRFLNAHLREMVCYIPRDDQISRRQWRRADGLRCQPSLVRLVPH